jgi:formamidopyrimidine-DNA glycosylase
LPELPDVEWANRRLRSWLSGATIRDARSSDRRILRPQSPAHFRRELAGKRVLDVSRRGKWLRVSLDGGSRLFSHLGMTGDWVTRDVEVPRLPSERARLDVVGEDGCTRSVRYLDPRRFGRLTVAREDIADWRALGPDPLVDGLEAVGLAGLLGRTRRSVKEALMDQSVLAGIGNILATEALWRARVDPRSRSDALSSRDVARIARGLRAEIEKELAQRSDDGEVEPASEFAVYGRAGMPCPRCGSPLVRVVLGGRVTTFCNHCQVRAVRSRSSA